MRNKKKASPRSTAAEASTTESVEPARENMDESRSKAELLLRMADKVTTASGNRRRRAMSEQSSEFSDIGDYCDALVTPDSSSPLPQHRQDSSETPSGIVVDDGDTKSFVTSDFDSSVDSMSGEQGNQKLGGVLDPLLNASITSGMVGACEESDVSVNSAPAWAPMNNSDKSPSSTERRRRSSINETAELKVQLRRCRQALMSIQENAALRYDKLEMKYADAQQRFQNQSRELATRTTTLNATLEQKEQTESEKKRLEVDLKKMKLERNKVVVENLELRQKMKKCPTCKSVLKNSNPPKIEDTKEKRKNTWMLGEFVEKIKISTEAAIHMLDLENETVVVTPSRSSEKNKSTSKKNALSTQSQHIYRPNRGGLQDQGRSTHSYNPGVVQISSSSSSVASSQNSRYNLDSSISEIQTEMDQELAKLKMKWKSSGVADYSSTTTRQKGTKENTTTTTASRIDNFLSRSAPLEEEKLDKRDSFSSRNSRQNKSTNKKKLSGLDAFFAAATPLNEEVLDEEQSFWTTKQRSVQKKSKKSSSASKKKKRNKISNPSVLPPKKVSKDSALAQTQEQNLNKLRNKSLLAPEISQRSSFRKKIATKLTELEGELVTDLTKSNGKSDNEEYEVVFNYSSVLEQPKYAILEKEDDPLADIDESMSNWSKKETAQIARV